MAENVDDKMAAAEVKANPAQTIPPTQIVLNSEPVLPNLAEKAPIMQKLLKNIEYKTVFKLGDLVNYTPGQVVSNTLVQNSGIGITIFAMAANEGISAHKSTGDALVLVLEGTGEITIDLKKYKLEKGQSIVMPAGLPHAVQALENFKMLLVVVFPEK